MAASSVAAQSAREYDSYFQTSDTLASQARRAAKSANRHGRPLALPAKLTAVALDPTSIVAAGGGNGHGCATRAYVAASDGAVRRVKLPSSDPRALAAAGDGDGGGIEDGSGSGAGAGAGAGAGSKTAVDMTLAGPSAPVTCLAVARTAVDGVLVLAGSWDKNLYAWSITGGKISGRQRRVFKGGHSDFVKSVAIYQRHRMADELGNIFGDASLLLSVSADRSLIFWDPSTGDKLLQLKNFHKTSLNVIVVDPASQATEDNSTFATISGSSDGEIFQTEFRVSSGGADGSSKLTVEATGRKTQLETHPTTIYDLAFSGDELDLVTASADGSATVMKRNEQVFGPWEVETRFRHEGHVRCVAAEVGDDPGPDGPRLFTGGRDENVKLWNASSGKLVRTFEGHFDEVTGIVTDGYGQLRRAISVSLDGTVRIWDDIEVDRMQKKGSEEIEESKAPRTSLMTAEEEAELAELMDDDDDDD